MVKTKKKAHAKKLYLQIREEGVFCLAATICEFYIHSMITAIANILQQNLVNGFSDDKNIRPCDLNAKHPNTV